MAHPCRLRRGPRDQRGRGLGRPGRGAQGRPQPPLAGSRALGLRRAGLQPGLRPRGRGGGGAAESALPPAPAGSSPLRSRGRRPGCPEQRDPTLGQGRGEQLSRRPLSCTRGPGTPSGQSRPPAPPTAPGRAAAGEARGTRLETKRRQGRPPASSPPGRGRNPSPKKGSAGGRAPAAGIRNCPAGHPKARAPGWQRRPGAQARATGRFPVGRQKPGRTRSNRRAQAAVLQEAGLGGFRRGCQAWPRGELSLCITTASPAAWAPGP
nr:translation initiation factor IF-2-like [Oryctolagus cuniculus]